MVSNDEQTRLKVINVDEEGRFGGPERRIVNVAANLEKLGTDTIIIMPKLESERFAKYAREAKVNYKTCDITRLSLEPSILVRYIVRFPYELILLLRLFRLYEAELVHVNGASQFKVAIAAKLSRKKVVWHLNNTFLKRSVKLVFSVVSKICADAIIYAGFRAGEYYQVNRKFNNICTANIEAPVLPSFFEVPVLERVNKCLRISVIGGINPAKSLENIIWVAKLLKEKKVSFEIRIAGKILSSQKRYKFILDESIRSNNLAKEVKFLGEVNDIPNLLLETDINLSMSNREASPTAVWEGLAAGRVVISTDVGSVSDHIVNAVNGFVIPVGDVNKAAGLISQISSNVFDIKKLSIEAKRTAEANFSLNEITKQHLAIYKTVIKKKVY